MKSLPLVLAALTAIAAIAAAPAAEPPAMTAGAAILIDPETRQVLYEHNADARMYPASLTKMMTALLVAESGDIERTITISARAASVGESTMHLSAGEELKLRYVLLGLLLNSANDSATACAEAMDGSVEKFLAHMNARAGQLGMTGTRFTNPSGLHSDDHYSTARDLATLGIPVMANPELRQIVRMREAVVPWPGHPQDRKLVNRNRLLAQWDACDGIKTGYTKQAGRCLAASAYVDGWRLIAVVLKSKDAWTDARNLLQWGFGTYYKVALVARDVTRARLKVRGGAEDSVDAVAVEDVIAVIPQQERPAEPTLEEDSVRAPVTAGEVIAYVTVRTPAGEIKRVGMKAVSNVVQSPWAMLWSDPRSLWGAAALLAAAVGVLIYAAASEAVGARRLRRSPEV